MNSEVECPLCTQIGFQSVDALRIALVSAASRNLTCPVCNASLTGLDKLTVHLFGHTLPQHELQTVCQLIRPNDISNIDTPGTECSIFKPVTVTPQETNKKVEVVPPSAIPLQNYENFQQVTLPNKLTETTSVLNQDLSSLLCWLPVTCFPEKFSNPAINTVSSVNSELLQNRTNVQIQQNDGKGENRLSLGTMENNILNKDSSFLIVSLPSLQDLKKQSDLRVVSNNTNNNSNELSVSDVSSLSGKLLMLDCSGNSQCRSNLSNTSEPSSIQISVLPEQQNHSHAPLVKILSPNQNTSLPSREVSNTATSLSSPMKGDSVEEKKQNSEGEITKSSNEILKCNLCLSQFSDSNILILHHQLVHEGSNSLQPNLTASTQESTSEQGMDPVENKEDLFQCHLCSKTFYMQGSLMVHLRVAHTAATMVGLASRIKGSIISDLPSASTVSSLSAGNSKNSKDQSQAKSNDNKQWECSDCGKFFTTKYFLKKHKRLHTGEMPYSCPTCGKSFTFQQSYHKHLLYHSDEKPHTCTECGRSFKELSTLHNHQRIHTGEKPWACETCGKCFRQRVSYLVHRRIHTGAMPYCCTVCNKSFRYKVSQRTHKCIAQPSGGITRQSGYLLERLLFEQPEENTLAQNQESRREGIPEKQTHEQVEATPFVQQKQSEEIQSALTTPQSKQQTGKHGAQLLFSSLNNDKSVFPQRLEPNTSDFNLHNFQLQQTLSNIHSGNALSPNNALLHQNVSLSAKDELKQNAVDDKSHVNLSNSTWCPDKQSSHRQNTNLNSSSLVVLVNDKEMISALPNTSVPVSLLQVLQKEKCSYTNELPTHASVSTNNLQSSTPCPGTVKVSNTILSSPFVPDFLSMAMSAPNHTQNPMSDCGSSNVSLVGDPFQWEMSLDMPSQDRSDSMTDNVQASQDTIDSLQSLLFGSHSTQL